MRPRIGSAEALTKVSAARMAHLDMLRGIAALMVVAGHLRAFVFSNFSSATGSLGGTFELAFYFITGLGHQSVLAFFALSGFLVGGRALQDIITGHFVWKTYLLRRLTRLWIVIIPALFLTFAFDSIGLIFTQGAGYDGRYYEIFNSGPSEPAGITLSIKTFIGNLFFLQTILVPVFGSNGPMWSLANEFWYYVFFPALAIVIFQWTSRRVNLWSVLVVILIFALLPFEILSLGVIWVLGALTYICSRFDPVRPFLDRWSVRTLALALLGGSLLLSRSRYVDIPDLVLGAFIAAALPVLALCPTPGQFYSRIARSISEISYTVYLTHFPLMMLIVVTCFGANRLSPSPSGFFVYVVLFVIVITWSAIVYWCFERNTNDVYRWLKARLIAT